MSKRNGFRIGGSDFAAMLRISAAWLAVMMIITVLPLPVYAESGRGGSASRIDNSSTSGNDAEVLPGLPLPADDSEEKEKEQDPVIAQVDTSSENPCITWFVHGIRGKVEETEVFIGAEKAEVSETGRLTDGYLAPKTLILIDNSVSTGTRGNQEKIQTILTRLIWNHQADEQIAIKTFAEESEILMDYTDNYDELRLAVEKIEYKDQPTDLRNVLYKEITDLLEDGKLDYCRIILISDGTDDSRYGVTYEELMDLISRDNGCFPIYTIGCYFESSEKFLDRLYAISRLTGCPWYSLDDFDTAEEAAEIADEIRSDGDNANYFRFSLPTELKDGSRKNVGLYVKTSQEEYNLSKLMILPRGTVQEMRELDEQKRAGQKEAEKEAQKEKNSGAKTEEETAEDKLDEETESKLKKIFDNKWLHLLLLPCILLLILLGVYFKDHRGSRTFHDGDEKAGDMPGAFKADSEAAPSPNDPGQQISLIDLAHPERAFYVRNGTEAVIGRTSARCDIAFPEDRMLAARHALISMQNGRAVLDSLGHGDDISVKGKNVDKTVELFDGDVIELGNTRLRVRYD